MNTRDKIKEIIKEKYGQIAKESGSCCDPTSCCGTENKIVGYTVMQDKYDHLNGYVKDADLGLGCGLPTEYAGIKAGDTVVDLGSGAGNDVFIARSIAGENGKVIGIDFTEEMIEKAEKNNKKLGYNNVEFKFGDIEEIPLDNEEADVVVSNCVLNLVPDKEKAFGEIYRILKEDGHFCVSDIVIKGTMTEELKKSAVMYAGCVSGAVQEEEYLQIIKDSGFKNVEIKKSKKIELPEELLKEYLTEDGIKDYYEKLKGIVSITVVGYK